MTGLKRSLALWNTLTKKNVARDRLGSPNGYGGGLAYMNAAKDLCPEKKKNAGRGNAPNERLAVPNRWGGEKIPGTDHYLGGRDAERWPDGRWAGHWQGEKTAHRWVAVYLIKDI